MTESTSGLQHFDRAPDARLKGEAFERHEHMTDLVLLTHGTLRQMLSTAERALYDGLRRHYRE